MASTNQSPEYKKAQGKFLAAQTDEERLEALEEMIKECPKHKSSENMLANLKTRYKRLKEKIEKGKKKTKKADKQTIKKQDLQVVIIGMTNTGKSSLLSLLTNAHPEISPGNYVAFTTKFPIQGILKYQGVNIQLIENPSFESEYYDKGLTNSADVLLILITDLNQIPEIESDLQKSKAKRLIVFNKSDNLPESEQRKIQERLKSKKYNSILISTKTKQNLEELKEKIFQNFDKIRVYTKEPGKPKSDKPVILEKNSTVRDVAEKILHIRNMDNIKETKIWGPSSKFPGQIVGLNHELKDLDVVEFKTK